MTDKLSSQISLLNFDSKGQKEPILNSPRSLEACRRQGIDPYELICRSVLEIKEIYKDKNFCKEGLEIMTQHYEEKRKEKERAQLIEDEKNGYLDFSKTKDKKLATSSEQMTKSRLNDLLNSKTDSTLIEKEKKQLERIKQRQEKEIKQVLDYEEKMTDNKKKQEEKLEQQRVRDKLKEHENFLKRKETDEKKRQQELEKEQKRRELEEMKERLLEEAKKREEERFNKENDMKRRRQTELEKREEEQRKKHEEFLKKNEEKALERQQEILQRKQQLENQDKQRLELLNTQLMIKKQKADEKRHEKDEKLRQAKEKNDELLSKKREEFDEKQIKNEEKRKLFEFERQRRFEESKKQAELHAQLIQKVLEDNEKLQEEKREKFKVKETHAEEKKRDLEKLAEIEREKAKEEERIREEQRQQVKQNMETRLNEKVNKYLEIMESGEVKLQKTRQAKEEEARKRNIENMIEKIDKAELIQRKYKMDEYQRQKIMEKLENANEKGEKIKQERAALLEMRAVVKKEMQANKQELLEKFEKAKTGKLNAATDQSERAKFSSSIMPRISHNKSPADMNYSTIESTRNTYDGRESKMANTSNFASTKKVEKVKKQADVGLGIKLIDEKEARKGLEELKMKLNQEMLRLLEDEHNKENQREAKLASIKDQTEKKRYEKTFVSEKAKSHTKIQQLSAAHADAVEQFLSKLNVKALG